VSADGRVGLLPPPGFDETPPFDRGWTTRAGRVQPFLSYVGAVDGVNWSDELEILHEESSRDHPIDVWTRRATLACLGSVPSGAVLMDLGCSTGFLLQDLRAAHPDADLIGVDLIASGLEKAHANVPEARLLQADVCELPLADASVDGAVSLNLLEHVPEDERALAELARVLRPGARAVLVVPSGSQLYDYYDRFLGHERRYARGELSRKAARAGLEVLDDLHLGGLIYPAFRFVKRRNRRRYGGLSDDALEARVMDDIASTRRSRLVRVALKAEEPLLARRIPLPFGVRGLTVVRRPS
jgi:ubiquinone/menaquinone biosynthesis C-methylase UbiE